MSLTSGYVVMTGDWGATAARIVGGDQPLVGAAHGSGRALRDRRDIDH